jgi:GntR family transcriptional repressor for pyruvate dehydrogenase complex
MFGPARTPRVYEHIVTEIERTIFEGRLRNGDKLPPERQLAQQYGASRVAVREALRALELRGLLEVRQGSAGGHFVREVDGGAVVRDLQTLLRRGRLSVPQIAEARLLLEPEVARLAALRATDVDVKELTAVIETRAAARLEGRSPRALDIEFHRLVAETARNPVHTVVIHALMDLEAAVVLPRTWLTDTDDAAIDLAHHDVREAIARRDAERARAAMQAHIADVQQRLRRAEVDPRGV